jgi:hypothetical protein
MSTDEIFRHTFYNSNRLPWGVWLVGDSSIFYDWPGFAIIRCTGRYPDHDRSSGEVCDPESPILDWDQSIEFYEDSLRPGAQVLCCRETDIFLRELVTSMPALEKEIRRRDDIEGIPGRARIKAAEAAFEAERERRRFAALSPAMTKHAEDMRAGRIPFPSAPAAEEPTTFKPRLGPKLLGKKGRR